MACAPFFHSYSPWADKMQSDEGAILIQERRCGKCNKAQRRQTAWMGGGYDRLGDEIGQ